MSLVVLFLHKTRNSVVQYKNLKGCLYVVPHMLVFVCTWIHTYACIHSILLVLLCWLADRYAVTIVFVCVC